MGRHNKLFKRGNIWYADLRTIGLGKPSLATSDLVVAKAKLRDYELGTTGQAAYPPKALDEAIDAMAALKKFETAEFYREKGSILCRHLGAKTDINSLEASTVADFCIARLKEGASRHTIYKELTCLRQTLKSAKRRKEYGGPLDIFPEWPVDYEPETRWLSPDEFAKLLNAVPEERRTWLMVQAYTGAEMGVMNRFASMPRGGWEHVSLLRAKITLPGTKRSSRYRVDMPLHPELKTWLSKLDPKAPLIAPWKAVNRDLKKACKAAGIDAVSTHDFRRTFGSWMVQNGVDLHHVARLMGNSYIMVSKVYGQTSDASYTAAINTLPKLKKLRSRKS
jgi:integrase